MSFVTVRYGAGEEKLVNPNTLNGVLLSHLKKSCGFESLTDPVDLASETGEVMDLMSRPKEYARKILEGRGVYILIKVIGDEGTLQDEGSPSFVSLLDQPAGGLKFSITNAASSTKKGIKSSNAKAARGTIEGTAFKGLLPTGMSGLGASSDTLDKSSSNVMRGKGTLPGGMNTLPPKGSSAGPTTGTEEAGSPTKKKGSSPLKKS